MCSPSICLSVCLGSWWPDCNAGSPQPEQTADREQFRRWEKAGILISYSLLYIFLFVYYEEDRIAFLTVTYCNCTAQSLRLQPYTSLISSITRSLVFFSVSKLTTIVIHSSISTVIWISTWKQYMSGFWTHISGPDASCIPLWVRRLV